MEKEGRIKPQRTQRTQRKKFLGAPLARNPFLLCDRCGLYG